jgi:hypothetical protein
MKILIILIYITTFIRLNQNRSLSATFTTTLTSKLIISEITTAKYDSP